MTTTNRLEREGKQENHNGWDILSLDEISYI